MSSIDAGASPEAGPVDAEPDVPVQPVIYTIVAHNSYVNVMKTATGGMGYTITDDRGVDVTAMVTASVASADPSIASALVASPGMIAVTGVEAGAPAAALYLAFIVLGMGYGIWAAFSTADLERRRLGLALAAVFPAWLAVTTMPRSA